MQTRRCRNLARDGDPQGERQAGRDGDSPTSLTVAAGSSGTYRVGLTSEPLDAVTVTVNSPSDGVTITGSPLVFMPANWDSDQTVTVNVAADAGKGRRHSPSR